MDLRRESKRNWADNLVDGIPMPALAGPPAGPGLVGSVNRLLSRWRGMTGERSPALKLVAAVRERGQSGVGTVLEDRTQGQSGAKRSEEG